MGFLDFLTPIVDSGVPEAGAEAISPIVDSGIPEFGGELVRQFGDTGANSGGSLANLFSGFGNFFDEKTLKMLAALGIPAATLGVGSLLGSSAGSSVQDQIRKLQQQNSQATTIANQRAGNPEPADIQTILKELDSVVAPQINRLLEEGRLGERNLNNKFIASGLDLGSPAISAQARLREGTARGISEALAGALERERALRLNTRSSDLASAIQANNQNANLGLQGLGLASDTATKAGQIPSQALLLSAILGSKGGLLGA